jgi:glycosyltransferase involved in cell wall biosynthesis
VTAIPFVSVLLPFRDAGEWLPAAAESVLAQRDVTVELIAIDDGSADEGPAYLAGLAERDPRVSLVRARGIGIAAALELGRRLARAPFIARMDGDDLCAPRRMARQVEALEREPLLAAVGTRVEAFPSEAVGEGMRRYIEWQNGIVAPEEHASELFVESPLCHPSVMLRTSALEEVGGWREVPWPEDYDLWLRLDARGYLLAKVPEVLLRWRHRPGRATFSDPRYGAAQFRAVKAPHLARRLKSLGRPTVFWGAGPTGKRLARELEAHGVVPQCFIDIDPRKIGGKARGVPVVPPEEVAPGMATVVVAVGARGAREEIRAYLRGRGFGEDEVLFAA